MTLLTVVRDVCATVGVTLPTTVFGNINTDRTAQEMLALANEVAQRIAYDTRDWQALRHAITFVGDGVLNPVTNAMEGTISFPLPANYRRMMLTGNVRRSDNPSTPMRFIPDYDQWIERRLSQSGDNPYGEWIITDNQMTIWPVMSVGITALFPYIDKNCIHLASGGHGDRFVDDADRYRLDERVLKLGMIWQWKAQKGAPYAEDMGSFSDALALVMGTDSPSPIIVGRAPMSNWNNNAYY